MFHFKIKLTMCNKTFSIFNGFSEFHLKRLSQKIPKSVMVVLRKLWWFLLSRKKIFFIFTDTFLKLKASFDKKCDLYRNREFNFLKMFRILSYKWLLFHDDISRVVTLENSVPNNNFVNWKKISAAFLEKERYLISFNYVSDESRIHSLQWYIFICLRIKNNSKWNLVKLFLNENQVTVYTLNRVSSVKKERKISHHYFNNA